MMSDNNHIMAGFDGLMAPSNPNGYGCGGWWITKGAMTIAEGSKCFYQPADKATSNMAEYRSLIDLLQNLVLLGETGVEIQGDSNLIINQVIGEFKVKSNLLRPLFEEATELMEKVAPKLVWVPREKNARADFLAQQAYAKVAGSSTRQVRMEGQITTLDMAEYVCDGCRCTYVARSGLGSRYCFKCGCQLIRMTFKWANMPAPRVIHLLREAGYRTIMYFQPEDRPDVEEKKNSS